MNADRQCSCTVLLCGEPGLAEITVWWRAD